MRSGKVNKTAFSKCFECFKIEAAKSKKNKVGAISCGALSISALILPRNKTVALDHHIFSNEEWSRIRNQEHPRVNIKQETTVMFFFGMRKICKKYEKK